MPREVKELIDDGSIIGEVLKNAIATLDLYGALEDYSTEQQKKQFLEEQFILALETHFDMMRNVKL